MFLMFGSHEKLEIANNRFWNLGDKLVKHFICDSWLLIHKEGWAPKSWYLPIVVLEKTLESLGQQGDQTSQS